MARLSTMTHDRHTGRLRRKDPKRVRAGKKAARKRHGRHLKASTKRKISMSNKRTHRTHRTKAGRRVLTPAKHAGHRATAKKHRGPGRPPGFHHSPATRKKMAASHRKRWKTHGARYRRARRA